MRWPGVLSEKVVPGTTRPQFSRPQFSRPQFSQPQFPQRKLYPVPPGPSFPGPSFPAPVSRPQFPPVSRPFLIEAEEGGFAPEFRVDWKDSGAAEREADFGWPDVERILRVRTAIDKETLAARGEQLFGMETVNPGGNVWRTQIDFTAVPASERQQTALELASVMSGGLNRLGKTKASASILFGGATWPSPSAISPTSAPPSEVVLSFEASSENKPSDCNTRSVIVRK